MLSNHYARPGRASEGNWAPGRSRSREARSGGRPLG